MRNVSGFLASFLGLMLRLVVMILLLFALAPCVGLWVAAILTVGAELSADFTRADRDALWGNWWGALLSKGGTRWQVLIRLTPMMLLLLPVLVTIVVKRAVVLRSFLLLTVDREAADGLLVTLVGYMIFRAVKGMWRLAREC